MAYKIKVDGTQETLPDCQLETLQKAVGGNIEVVYLEHNKVMVLNEEGKLEGLPVNLKATAMTRGIVADDDLIVGDVVIAEATEDGNMN